jgi:hypothetical protein
MYKVEDNELKQQLLAEHPSLGVLPITLDTSVLVLSRFQQQLLAQMNLLYTTQDIKVKMAGRYGMCPLSSPAAQQLLPYVVSSVSKKSS